MSQPCKCLEKECAWQREQELHILCQGCAWDGLRSERWPWRRGQSEGREMGEDEGAEVGMGKSMSTLAAPWEGVWLLEEGVICETIMGQKCNWVLGLSLWPVLYIYYSSSLFSGIGYCWKQEMSGGLVCPSEMTALVAARSSHCPGWTRPPHLDFSPYSTPTHPKDLLANAITSLISFLIRSLYCFSRWST